MKRKIISILFLIVGILLIFGAKVNAGGGTVPYILFYNDNNSKIVYSSFIVENEMNNASYDKKTNTLTINNLSTDMRLECFGMGSDFKLKVLGNNSIGHIFMEKPDDSKLCSLNIIGDGTLTINKNKKFDEAILIAEWDDKSKLNFGKNVTVNMYAKDHVIEVSASGLDNANNVITFENKQNIVNTKKEKYTVSYDPMKTVEAYNLNNDQDYIWELKNASDPAGKYGTYQIGYYPNGQTIYECISKYEYNENFNSYFEVEEIGRAEEGEAKKQGYTRGDEVPFDAYSIEHPAIYKDKNGKEYAVMSVYENYNNVQKVYDLKQISGLKYPTLVENTNVKFSDLTEIREHVENVIEGRYNYFVNGTYLQIKGIPTPRASVSKTEFTYNKKVQKPTLTVKDSTGKILKNGTDYTVSFSNKNSKNVGRYTITISFKGIYVGTKKFTYDIKPKGTSLKKLTKGSKQFKVQWNKNATQTTGYQVQYSTNKNFKSGNKTVTVKKNKTTSNTVKKLKKNKKYFVRIRTYKTVKVNGKNVNLYSGWSKVKYVTTKK